MLFDRTFDREGALLKQFAGSMLRTTARAFGRGQPAAPAPYAPAEIATALYRGILDREPDADGLGNMARHLAAGKPIDAVVKELLASSEFTLNVFKQLFPPHTLPDLTQLHPERYER